MALRVVVLAGFGRLELTAALAETAGRDVDLVLIDKADAFVFGFSKLHLLFGRATRCGPLCYRDIVKPGAVRRIDRAIDPAAEGSSPMRHVDARSWWRLAQTSCRQRHQDSWRPRVSRSTARSRRVKSCRPSRAAVIVSVAGRPYEAASRAKLSRSLHIPDGTRTPPGIGHLLVMPFPVPVPPSPETSRALLEIFAERGITFVKDNLVTAIDPVRKVAKLTGGSELPFDLFFGIPVHHVPPVVVASGLSSAPGDWVAVDKRTLETKFPGVYAIGDVNDVGTPKAGVFAEGAALVVAASIVATLRSTPRRVPQRARLLLRRSAMTWSAAWTWTFSADPRHRQFQPLEGAQGRKNRVQNEPQGSLVWPAVIMSGRAARARRL
jgi:sulfide:quinone oxidoreductase